MNRRSLRKKFNLFLLMFPVLASSQGTGSITGIIAEKSTGLPLEFAVIGLQNAKDSALIGSAQSDAAGSFSFTGLSYGSYRLRIYFIGFREKFLPVSLSAVNPARNFDTIKIVSGNLLSEVEVVTEKDVYETAIDRKIYNVEKDLQSTSGSASDVLQNVPSVSVDMDGIVSLRGSSNITIFIDGKPSPLMKVSSAAALQAIPANTIERIEIITNPSAKQRVDGIGGIINIVLKKGGKKRFNGTVTANAGNDDRYNGTVYLNYNPSRFNISATYGGRRDYRYRTFTEKREQFDAQANPVNTFEQRSVAWLRPVSHNANLEIAYDINKNNRVSAAGTIFYNSFRRNETIATSFRDSAGALTSDFDRKRISPEYEFEQEASLGYEHKFKKKDHAIECELTLAKQYEQEDITFTEIYRLPPSSTRFSKNVLNQGMRIGQFNADYTLPVTEESELEAGYSGELTLQELDFSATYFDDVGDAWFSDSQKTSRFDFTQTVHALYATYEQGIEDFSVKGGLRAEQVYISSYLITFDSLVPQDYFRLYPTLHLGYEIEEGRELNLSYSRRVNRPDGDELNPFPEYTNPRDIEAGNPYLKPEQVHSFELGFNYKSNAFTFVPALYYRHTYDAFTEISRFINDTVLLTTMLNLSTNRSTGLELVFNTRIKKKFSINLNGNAFYNQIDASNLGFAANRAGFLWMAKLNLNYTISKSVSAQVNSSYRAGRITPQGKTYPIFVLNSGFKWDLFKKRASLVVTISDVFNTLRWKNEIKIPVLFQESQSKRKSQIVYLGFTWRFGSKPKPGQEELRFDERF